MTRLFLSYAHADKDFVCPLVTELRELGFDVWIDTQLTGGTLWGSEIVKAISQADFFVLFISSASIKSGNVRREVDLAFEQGKKIIPLRLEKVDIPSGWKYQIAGIQWIEKENHEWKSKLLVALGELATITKPSLKNTNTSNPTLEQARVTVEDDNNIISGSTESAATRIIEIFERDFVRPSECDLASSFLKNLANNLSLKQQYLHLQFSLKKRIFALVNQIDEFRKICQTETSRTDNEKKSILEKLENLLQEANDIKMYN
jgi:hypothetical protein